MAIAIGNKTFGNNNPNSSSQTLMHNQTTGADRGLLAVVTMANTVDFTGATYGAVAMTQVRNDNYTADSQRVGVYYLANPAEGFNAFRVTFSGNQTNSTSIALISFTGADGVDSHGALGTTTTPNSRTLTILQNSIIYAGGMSAAAQNTQYSIAGSTRPFEFPSHNTNKIVRGCLSATGLPAGDTNVTTYADSGNVTNTRVAIKEKVATRRRIIIM